MSDDDRSRQATPDALYQAALAAELAATGQAPLAPMPEPSAPAPPTGTAPGPSAPPGIAPPRGGSSSSPADSAQVAPTQAAVPPRTSTDAARDGTGGSTAPPVSAVPAAVASSTAPAGAPELAPAGGPALAPAGGSGPPARSGWWRMGFPVMIAVLALCVPVLVLAGRRVILTSTDGLLVNAVTDPAAPGWQAITDPTPTLLVVHVDAAQVPTGLTVMSLTGGDAGGTVFVPLDTVLTLPDGTQTTFRRVAADGGLEALQAAVEGTFGAGMGEVIVLDPQQLSDLVAPVGPLTVENPDAVVAVAADGTEQVVFPQGTISLPAAQAAAYLDTRNPDENDLNRLVRHQAFWEGWLAKVRAAGDDPGAVPGETDAGLGRFVRALADARVEYHSLPVTTLRVPGIDAEAFLAISDQVAVLVARIIPYPVGAPEGARPRVRLLDGTGELDHGLVVVPVIVSAGGQVEIVGNADAFGRATTQVVYYDDAQVAAAGKIRDALGVGELIRSEEAVAGVDVTVVLGADYAALPPRPLAVPTTTTVEDGVVVDPLTDPTADAATDPSAGGTDG